MTETDAQQLNGGVNGVSEKQQKPLMPEADGVGATPMPGGPGGALGNPESSVPVGGVDGVNGAGLSQNGGAVPPEGMSATEAAMMGEGGREASGVFRMRGQNTQVYTVEGDTIIRLHQTNIVTIRANGDLSLSSGGWRTHQTLKGMNMTLKTFAPGLSVVTDGHVAEGAWRVTNGREWSVQFFDGVTVQGAGPQNLAAQAAQVPNLFEQMSINSGGYDGAGMGGSGGGGGGGFGMRPGRGGGGGGGGRSHQGGRMGSGRGSDGSRSRPPLAAPPPMPEVETECNLEAYDDIPVEASGEECPAPIESFADVTLHPLLKANIDMNKFAKPTPVQRHSLPVGMARRDLMACAQTGSGKTGGFLFPVLHQMLTEFDEKPDEFKQRGRAEPRCLILAPTRELATQILRETQKFAQQSPVQPVVVYGGAEIRVQIAQLERGCSLLVATPGRLCDLIERGKVSLAKVRFLVLDEADRMLDMGFEPQIRRVVEHEGMPTSETRQTLMFSATFPKEIQKLASEFMTRYIFVAVGRVGSTTALITQTVLWTEEQDKHRVLVDLLAAQQGRTIIFVETKRAAEQLEDFLYRSNVPATSIHGDRTQREREQALLGFRKGAPATLVATDVAARGLDVPDCLHVINYELPRDINSYVHRIGRTGRMGRQGNATSLFSWANKGVARELVSLLQEAQQQCPEWLAKLAAESGPGSRGYGGRGKFGGRDYRANAQVRQYHHSGGGAPGAYGQQAGLQAQAGYGGRGMGYGMAQGYSAMSAKQPGMGGMYGQVDGGAAGWANWAGQMGMAAPAGGYPQQITQGGRAGGYGAGVGQTSESWMAQQAQYAQYYSQQGAQGYAQQGSQGYGAQGYVQQAATGGYVQQAANGGEGGSGGMVPIGGMMWPQSQQPQAAANGQEAQYSASYAMQPPQ